MTRQRRDVLGLLAGGALASAAGCLDSVSQTFGSSGSDSSGNAPLYDRWVPEGLPSPHGGTSFFFTDVATLRRRADTLPRSVTEDVFDDFVPEDRLGISAESVEAALNFYGATITAGSFDEAAVVDAIDPDPDDGVDYDDFTVYESPGPEFRNDLAVSSSVLLQVDPDVRYEQTDEGEDGAGEESPSTETAADADRTLPAGIETLIDTGTGDADRLQAVDDDVAALVDALDEPDYLICQTFEEPGTLPEGAVGATIGFAFGRRRTTARINVVFESAAAVDEAGVRDAIESDGVFDHYDDPTFETGGRIVTGTADRPTDEFNFFEAPPEADEETPDEAAEQPRVGVQIDADSSGDVSVIIVSMETPISRLQVLVNGSAEAVLDEPQVGDTVDLSAESGDQIRVVATSEAGVEAVVASYEVE